MANVHGKAGHGAMVQAVESATKRLSPESGKTKPVYGLSKEKDYSGARKFFLILFGLFTFIGIVPQDWGFVVFNGFITFLIWATTPNKPITYHKPIDPVDNITRDDMYRAYDKLRAGGEMKDSPFRGDEISWALGGLAEERTSKKLEYGLDSSYTVINDISLLDRGTVTANIDHLVLTDKGTIMVDTKVWANSLTFTQKDNKGTWLEKSTNPIAWSSVSTCLYEASFLPETPKSIIFAVGGKAGKDLEKYSSPVQITHYYERFDDTGNLQSCDPVTVLFVAQSKIADTIRELDDLPGTTTFSVGDYFALENLNF